MLCYTYYIPVCEGCRGREYIIYLLNIIYIYISILMYICVCSKYIYKYVCGVRGNYLGN